MIISESGRVLAEIAVRAGYDVAVIDRFGDLDTQQLARMVLVYRDEAGDFSNVSLLQSLIDCCYSDDMTGIVIGSGFESCPAVLERLAGQYPIIGNSADVLRAVKDPESFFPVLQSLHIPHPDTRFVPDGINGKWLCKRAGASGGMHIRSVSGTNAFPVEHYYFQKYVPGQPGSLLFLSDGHKVCGVGLNELLVSRNPLSQFAFSGAATLSMEQFTQINELEGIAGKLARHFGLVGLCGLDFISTDDTIYVLEVNPRPTSTLVLHDARGELFEAHLSACRGRLNYARTLQEKTCRAFAVYYPEHDIRITEPIEWPDWITDIPTPGQTLTVGVPVCTIYAEGVSRSEVMELLEQRRRQLTGIICSRSRSC